MSASVDVPTIKSISPNRKTQSDLRRTTHMYLQQSKRENTFEHV